MYVSALEVNFTQTPPPPSPANNASRSTIDGTIVASTTTRPTQPINIVAATKQRRPTTTTTTTKTMKMEVLARNQFQAQFDGIGSTKATDWTKPLTPPTSAIHQQQQHHHHHHHQQQQQQQQQLPTPPHQQDYHRQQQKPDLASPQQPTSDGYHNNNNNNNNNDTHHHHHPDDSAVGELSLRLQAELRAAKSRNLACTEVLLPMDLLDRIATDMVQMAEKEPCGIRGCSVFVEFEDEPGNSRRIASLQVGAGTVATFELYLTLRHDQSGWTAKLPQFLKNLARRSTIIISPEYTLIKNKLYNSFLE